MDGWATMENYDFDFSLNQKLATRTTTKVALKSLIFMVGFF